MTTHSYSTNYSPPIPICTVLLGAGGQEPQLGPIEALIDTGADITVVPVRYLRQVGVRPVDQSVARSLWGDSQLVHVYAVSLRVANLQIRALQVIGDAHGNELILGRSVLNRLHVTLDGPASIVEIVESRTV